MDDLDIFSAALELGTPEERERYLLEACGDNADLRERIEALLRSSEKVSRFMESPAVAIEGPPTIDQPITEKPGTQIGPYKLLQQIGEGGMGVVYMAEQKEPVKRRVALKIIKPGMDTRQVIARFEAERQALAMMDHPNIAKVLDAGATESGRPYFVMELVNGLPVTKYCDEQHLTPKQRLELFVPICQAVQHAHQKGLIHRDLKPSNILVALYDGQAVPKIIDFGVAKATNQTLTEKTIFTQLGQVVGTLEYMSPEQAERNQLDADTRSDIYSLGVVLYELLTGETPFDRERLRSAAFEEMLRIIREEEPSKPSTKVSSSGSLPSIAANRRIEPAKLCRMIRGELDWIVLKALEKDRGRRYETASKFAEDVQHYLNDEPVVACPPSTAYRMKKLLRRHRIAVGTATLVFCSLLIGLVTTIWQSSVARENYRREQEAHHATELQKRRAEKAESDAQSRFELAQAAVRTYLDRVTDDARLNEADFYDLRRQLLESAKSFYDQLAAQESAAPALIEDRGMFLLRLANVYDELNDRESAIENYRNGLREFERLIILSPDNPQYRRLLAGGHNDLALASASSGQLSEAHDHHFSAIKVREQLIGDLEQPQARNQARGELVESHLNLGSLLHNTNRGVAKEHYETARAIAEELVAEERESIWFRRLLGGAENSLMNLLCVERDWEAARLHGERALQLRREVQRERADSPYYADEAAGTLHNLGLVLLGTGERQLAQARFEEAIAVQQTLADNFPKVYAYSQALAQSHLNLGDCFAEMQDFDSARHHLATAIALQDELADVNASVIKEHGLACHHLGKSLREAGQPEQALIQYDRGHQLLTESLSRPTTSPYARQRLMNLLLDRAQTFETLKRHADAVRDWQELEELVAPSLRAGIQSRTAMARVRTGDVEAGVRAANELAERDDVTNETLYNCACVLSVSASQSDATEAEELASQAVRLLFRARTGGLFAQPGSLAHLEQDTDLSFLRDRSDFRELLEGDEE